MTMKANRVPTRPPYEFDPDATVFFDTAGVPYLPPISATGPRVFTATGREPVLYRRGTVRGFSGFIQPASPTASFLDTTRGVAFVPGRFATPGRVIRAARTVVLLFGGTLDGVETAVAAAAGATAAGASIVAGPIGYLDNMATLTAWAPRALVHTSAFGTETDWIPPEAWVGGEVLVIYCSFGNQPFPEGNSGTLDSAWVAAEQAMFGRMLARVDRFRGVIMYDPDPPPPDPPPDPGDPPPLPFATGFSGICGGLPWYASPVSGGQNQDAFSGAIAGEIAAFWG